ncbi:MAG: Aerobic glycerol-3-phosphate dehydrogenase [Bacteroidia bacterium]|nr:Aerobic glycerol-3-phosphate dehydrogenase [Bacteroidia bacterium]
MFSAIHRNSFIEQLQSKEFDLLVIGGGITGAGIALDAAARGMSVALVEKQDFAAGTSSRSTKLIHGGLRYLKQFEFGLVMEVGREREIVYRNAPHLVIPEKMMLPITEHGSLSMLSSSVGIYVYDMLAGVKRSERRRMLNKNETLAHEPLLKKEKLKGAALYTEYRTDDARLTIEILKTAVKKGATCLNYVAAEEFVYSSGKVCGAKVHDVFSDRKLEIKAKKVVNACGPWVDKLREKDNSLKGKRLHLTKGVHLVFEHNKLPLSQSLYFDVSDGRMIFAIPRGNATYVGTTDTNYTGELERPTVTKQDVAYLLAAVNNMFEGISLTEKDIASSWCGLRPLIHEDGKSPSELSRKDEIFISESGVISIAGGKLTGYRKMAEKTVNLVAKQIQHETGKTFSSCTTDKITLSGGNFENPKAVSKFIASLLPIAKETGFPSEELNKLVYKYGTNTSLILEKAKEFSSLETAEIWYSVNYEMTTSLSDYLIRRTGRLYFERPEITTGYNKYFEQLLSILGTNNTIPKNSLKEFEIELSSVVDFQ